MVIVMMVVVMMMVVGGLWWECLLQVAVQLCVSRLILDVLSIVRRFLL